MDGVNWVAAPITRAELVERIGKRFVVIADCGLYDDDLAPWNYFSKEE